jgi:hypothetical protein
MIKITKTSFTISKYAGIILFLERPGIESSGLTTIPINFEEIKKSNSVSIQYVK